MSFCTTVQATSDLTKNPLSTMQGSAEATISSAISSQRAISSGVMLGVARPGVVALPSSGSGFIMSMSSCTFTWRKWHPSCRVTSDRQVNESLPPALGVVETKRGASRMLAVRTAFSARRMEQ